MSFALALSPLFLAAAAAEAPCTPIADWEQVIADEQVRWVLLGELHGNNETPQIFADAVCLTARTRPVVVALEQPAGEQAAIDRFIASDGGEEAKRAFLASPMWNGSFKDGRSSEAYFRLFETFRQMRSAGGIVGVIAFVPGPMTSPSPLEYEKAMAEQLRAAAGDNAMVLALVGNVHAMRTEVSWRGGYLPMAGHLPSEATVTLDVRGAGGESWNCSGQPMVCGPHPSSAPPQVQARAVQLGAGEPSYSGRLHLGVPTTASAPQVGEDALAAN